MLDVAIAFNRYKFLGFEFLTWLWFLMDQDHKKIKKLVPDLVSLQIGNRIVLENQRNETVETITIKGDDAGLEEGILSLKKGAVVTELNLSYKAGDQNWQFTVKGESLNISNLKTPETAPIETKEDIEGALIEKSYLYNQVLQLIDKLFTHFIQTRVSNNWTQTVVPKLKQWINA
jgi:hypothetical protein